MFLSRIAGLFGSKSASADAKVPQLIYGAVVAQSRKSDFYTRFQIADNVMGRYNMLALHVFLLNYRLKPSNSNMDEKRQLMSQHLFDLFVIDLERGLRDLGFADTSVHKRKKKLVHSYYALIDEFDPLLENKNIPELENRISSRYFSDNETPVHKSTPENLAVYMLNVVESLTNQTDKALLQGKITWPHITKEQS